MATYLYEDNTRELMSTKDIYALLILLFILSIGLFNSNPSTERNHITGAATYDSSEAPTQDTPLLTSSRETNTSAENLSVSNISTADAQNDEVKNIITWYRNETSLLLLNIPMDGESTSDETRDYSGFNYDIHVQNAPWLNNTGHDNFGVYNFTVSLTNKTYLNVSYDQTFNVSIWTIEVWAYPHSTHGGVIVGKWKSSQEQDQWQLSFLSNNKYRCGANNFTGFQAADSPASTSYVRSWSHVICQFNGTDLLLYVNGELQTTKRITTVRNNDAEVHIGARRADQLFNGTIDDVKIWNESLSWEQINNSYLGRENQLHESMTSSGEIWSATITPNDRAHDGETKTSNSLLINSVPILATPILTSSEGGDTTTEDLTLYLSSLDANGDSVKSIVTWYKNGASTLLLSVPMDTAELLDFSGFNNEIHSYETTWFSTSGYDGFGAYNFTVGNRTYMNISHSNIFNTSTWTVEAWVYPHNSYAAGGVFLGKWKSSTEQDQWQLGYVSGNKFRCGANNFTYFQSISSSAKSPKNWYHVACTYDGANLTLYVNGNKESTQRINTIRNNDAEIQIGARRADQFFNGTVDDVKIWSQSLSWEQINNSYFERTLLDHTLTEEGDEWQAAVTPTDGIEAGETVLSNTVEIVSTTIETVLLASTYGTNTTEENLTVSLSSSEGITTIINWIVDEISFAALHLPFEGGSDSSSTREYSTSENDGTVSGATYEEESGVDGFGAYAFDGVDDSIVISDHERLDITDTLTMTSWVKRTAVLDDENAIILKKGDAYSFYASDTSSRVYCGDSAGYVRTTEHILIPNRWYYLACVISGTDVKIYANVKPDPIYTMGDSITVGYPNHNNSISGTYVTTPETINSSYEYWLDQLFGTYISAESTTTSYYNKARSGIACDGMNNLIRNYVPDNVTMILLCGTNDLMGGQSAEGIKGEIVSLYNLTSSKNISLIMMSVPPRGNGMVCTQATLLNTWLETNFTNYSISGNNITFVDIHPLLTNGTTCYYNASLYVDKIHPNEEGQRIIAQAIWETAFNSETYDDLYEQEVEATTGWDGIETTNEEDITIGIAGDGSSGFTALLDDIRTYDRALSAVQLELFRNDVNTVIVSDELTVGETWYAQATENDGTDDIGTEISNSVTIVS